MPRRHAVAESELGDNDYDESDDVPSRPRRKDSRWEGGLPSSDRGGGGVTRGATIVSRARTSSDRKSNDDDAPNTKGPLHQRPMDKLGQLHHYHDAARNSGLPPAYHLKPRFLNCLVLGSAIPFSVPFNDSSLPVSSLTFSISAMLSALGLNLTVKRPIELFLVNNRSPTNPTLLPSDRMLHPSNPAFAAITSSMHEEDVVERTVVLLAGRCMWVNGPMKSAALRDLIDMEAVGGTGVDVLVLVPTDPRAAIGGATTPTSGMVVGIIGGVPGAVSVLGHRPVPPPRSASQESFYPTMVPQMIMPPRRSLSTSTTSNVLPYGHGGTISSFQTRNTSLDESVYQGSYTPDGRGLVEGYYLYPPTLPALPTKPGSEQYKRNQLTVRRILLIVGVLVVLATILAIVAVVVTHKPLPSTTDGPPAPPKSTPNANCKTTLFDDFTRPNTNNVGLVTGAGGDIQALAWTSNLTFFPSGYTGYYYENVRDVIIADNGTTTTCKAAPSFGRYVAFSMAGSGTFHINVQVGCAKVVNKSAAFNLTASPPTDFVIDVDRLAGVGASADLSAVVWENMVFADRGVSWSLADFRGVSDVDDCGLAGATMIP